MPGDAGREKLPRISVFSLSAPASFSFLSLSHPPLLTSPPPHWLYSFCHDAVPTLLSPLFPALHPFLQPSSSPSPPPSAWRRCGWLRKPAHVVNAATGPAVSCREHCVCAFACQCVSVRRWESNWVREGCLISPLLTQPPSFPPLLPWSSSELHHAICRKNWGNNCMSVLEVCFCIKVNTSVWNVCMQVWVCVWCIYTLMQRPCSLSDFPRMQIKHQSQRAVTLLSCACESSWLSPCSV